MKDYTLDLDASFILSGKAAAQYSYLKERGYLPMMAAMYENGLFVDDEFRQGNVSPVVGPIPVYRLAKALVEESGKKIARIRADSASYQEELINALEEDGVQWTITADKNCAVMSLIDRIDEKDWTPFPGASGESVEVAETVHTRTGTSKAFRLLVKRVRDRSTPIGALMVSYRYWVVATNFGLEWSTPRVLEWHQQRGAFENFFKGLKNDVGVGYLPTGDLHANAVYFRIGVLAYNLFVGFRRDLLPAACRTWTLRTVRWRVFSIAGRIVRHARSLVLKLAANGDSLDLLARIRGQCHALFCPA